MKKKTFSKVMAVLMLIMVINALSYGTIIPLLYSFANRFGITAAGLGLLFASFSFCQFLATPIIGRLSDKYGRRPLLIASLIGTTISLALFASAKNVFMLFIARMLDGITGGNISVAQAVIADSQKPEDRPKFFGFLGAAFGFGFLIGPAVGGVLSKFGPTIPFWFAAFVAGIGSILAILVLPESRVKNSNLVKNKEKLFDFLKLWYALKTPTTGILLIIVLLTSIAQNAFIIGFQSTTVEVLKFSATQIGVIFTILGAVNIVMQTIGIKYLLKFASTQKLLKLSLILGAIVMSLFGFSSSKQAFIIILAIYMFIPPSSPFVTSLISISTKKEDQGGILGLSQSYTSLGQIIGPILAGFVANFYILSSFWLSGVILLFSVLIISRIPTTIKAVDL